MLASCGFDITVEKIFLILSIPGRCKICLNNCEKDLWDPSSNLDPIKIALFSPRERKAFGKSVG
jgi:hypothetical protein